MKYYVQKKDYDEDEIFSDNSLWEVVKHDTTRMRNENVFTGKINECESYINLVMSGYINE